MQLGLSNIITEVNPLEKFPILQQPIKDMRSINVLMIFILTAISTEMFGQQKKDSCCLSKKDFIGTWQRDSPIVGDGIGQNFKFFSNNSFLFNIGNDGDDMRNIVQLKGKYRLVKDTLYFTIVSRVILDGPIEIADGGIALNIFNIGDNKAKTVYERNPKELSTPCFITRYSNKHIRISAEVYYKVIDK